MGLGDMWHKTLVYFGLADDESWYDDDDQDGAAAHEDLERTYRERPNVRRIDQRRGRGSGDIDDIFAGDEPEPKRGGRSAPKRSDPGASTAVLRPAETARGSGGDLSKVYHIAPRSFNDAQPIADRFKRDIPVIINLQDADTQLAKRLIDFASGLTYALDGGMQRIADKVFLLTPRDVELSAEDRQRYLDPGFFNQA
jgi:cell division inhibitor SepF